MTGKEAFFCEADVRATYRFLAHPGRGVSELRIIAPRRGILGIGYFDNEDAFVQACDKANGTGNVYVGIQPRPARFMEQASNRVARLRHGAKDDDVPCVVAIVIDIDPERPKHTPATDAELAKAIKRGKQISTWAVEQGYVEPRLNMSGNGCQLWLAVPAYEVTDLNRRTITAQLKAFEAQIRNAFNGDGVAIDSIYNLSRIIKVIGTRSIKGKNTKQRPHRLSASLSTFERVEDAKLLDAIRVLPAEEKQTSNKHGAKSSPIIAGGLSDRVLELLESSTKLNALFEGRGKPTRGADGKRLDESSSGYDFSLALTLARRGVTDPSELAAAIWHRPNSEARAKGQSYVERTVERALSRATALHDNPQADAGDAGDAVQSDLPTIVVSDRELRDVTSEAIDAVTSANDPPVVFVRGTLPTRIQTTDKGAHHLEPFTTASMRGRLARVANWHKEIPLRNGGVRLMAVSPPLDAVYDLLSLPAWPFPSIEGVVECPAFAPNGELMTTPGYHPNAKLWVHLDHDFVVPTVDESPQDADVKKACDLLLNQLLGEFPFADVASRANVLAALLLPFVRPMIDGPTPLHLIDAPAPGTGKSLLGDAVVLPATGRPAMVMTEGRDDEEWRKRLTAAMTQAPVFLIIDNLRRRLDSSQLSAAITATTWTDRILGKTATVVLPVKNAWLATGNNVALSNEMTRRSIWIRLDAKVDQPWMRSGFRHADLRAWAKHNRGALVWAALTMGQAWVAAGKPRGSRHLGNFESWAQTMAGIFEVTGVPGFLDNAQELYARGDEETAEWREFVAQWWERFRDKEVQTEDLFQVATQNDLLGSTLGDKSERSQKTRLGKALAKMRDRVVGEHRIEAGGNDRRARKIYRLQSADGPSTLKTLPLFTTPEPATVGTETSAPASNAGQGPAREIIEI